MSRSKLPAERTTKEEHQLHKFFGVIKLMRQVQILASRVDKESRKFLRQFKATGRTPMVYDELLLDAETYYTVAHDLLKLMEQYLEGTHRRRFRVEAAYKQTAAIRSHLIRHAYDKPDGNPTTILGFTPTKGPILGGSLPRYRDLQGFNANHNALVNLIDSYKKDMRQMCVACGQVLNQEVVQTPDEWFSSCIACGFRNKIVPVFQLMKWN